MECAVPALLTPSSPVTALTRSPCTSLSPNRGIIFTSICILVFLSMVGIAFSPVSQPLWLFLASFPSTPWYHQLLLTLPERLLPRVLLGVPLLLTPLQIPHPDSGWDSQDSTEQTLRTPRVLNALTWGRVQVSTWLLSSLGDSNVHREKHICLHAYSQTLLGSFYGPIRYQGCKYIEILVVSRTYI